MILNPLINIYCAFGWNYDFSCSPVSPASTQSDNLSSASVSRSHTFLSANQRARKTTLIPWFPFAACLSHTVTMATQGGDVSRQWFRRRVVWQTGDFPPAINSYSTTTSTEKKTSLKLKFFWEWFRLIMKILLWCAAICFLANVIIIYSRRKN